MLETLKFSQVKAGSEWGRDSVKKKETEPITKVKGVSRRGAKTSLLKDIRRNIAKIKTIMKEKQNE